MSTRRLLFVFAFGAVGCAPIIPFHLAETAETLKAKQISLTLAAGGGNGRDVRSCCGGGSARVRLGLGHDMEVGGEIDAIGGSDFVALSGKASFKIAPVRYFALIAGLGGSGSINSGHGSPLYLGADVAGVFSTDPVAGVLRLYGGARFSFALPVSRHFYENVPTEGFVVPLGVSIAPSERVRLFVEGGFLGGWSFLKNPMSSDVDRLDWIGGYGAFAASYAWGR